MKTHLNSRAGDLIPLLFAALFVTLCATFAARAAEPLVWERRPNRPAPAQFDTYHGETLDFRCAFEGFGALPFEGASDVRLWYQTNGMGAAWWSVPATVSSNVLAAAWPPSADPGAGRVSFFFGAPSNAYAQAHVRFRNSPGPSPNNLDPPDVLDWQAELASVSNALAAAIDAVATNLPPGMTTNDVCAIVTNSVSFYTSTEYDKYNTWGIDQDSATFNISDVEWIDPNTCTLIGNGVRYTIDTLDDSSSQTICIDRKVSLYVENAYTDIPTLSMPHQWKLYYGIQETRFDDVATPLKLETHNSLGLARLSDLSPSVSNTVTKAFVEDLGIESGISAETAANIADTASAAAVANADTTYRRLIGITNLNQSVQCVNITDAVPSTLEIQLPTDGATKDWMVYVVSVTNVTLSLPAATWWMADVAYTNDVPPATPTAFWFSQITDVIYIIGRQELTEVTLP